MENKKDLDEFLSKQRKEAEERDTKRRAEKNKLNYINLVSIRTPTEIEALQVVPEKEAKKGLVAPIKLIKNKLKLAIYNPEIKETKKIIEELSEKYNLSLVIVSKSSLEHVWEYYKYIEEKKDSITGNINITPEKIEEISSEINNINKLSEKLKNLTKIKITEILEIILGGAIALKASDIHIEPNEENSNFRLRIDGILYSISDKISKKTQKLITTRIKLLSNLKLNIKDEAQDGRFTINLPKRKIEIRTSLIPSEFGETIVLRLLDPNALKINLEDLGWREDDLKIIRQEINKPNGLILNTGPTGSGKTTTLYSFLREKLTSEIKIITIEDPIEYHIDGISQTQTEPEAGYTFASGLRSILRQDPDVILVGEIRDPETAGIAINASLTGHMVFSTLHTNNAIGAIPRLLDLKTKPNILGPALSIIIAQRLVRKLCDECKIKQESTKESTKEINKFLKKLPNRVNKENYKKINIYKPNPEGCEKCNKIGYKGRTSIFEVFVISDKIKEEIYKNPTELTLKKIAKDQGMVTIQEDGILKTIKGITSFEEIEKTTGPINW
jgi:type IV pilus assembly protein PilB